MIYNLSLKRALGTASAATAAFGVLAIAGAPAAGAHSTHGPAAAVHSAHAPVKAAPTTTAAKASTSTAAKASITTAAKAPTTTAVKQAAKPSVGSSTILVGSVGGTSGAFASSGVAALDGALLGVGHVNRGGGVLGRKFTLQSYDDEASPTLATTLFKRLVKAGAVAVLGSNDAGAATTAAAGQLKVPDLGVIDQSAGTVLPWAWSSGPGSAAVGAVDAGYAVKHYKRVALLHDSSAYGSSAAGTIKGAFSAAHKSLVLDASVTEDLASGATVSFTSEVKQIKASGANCVIAWLTPQDMASLAQTLKSAHVHVKLIGNDAVTDSQTFSLLSGAAGNGTIAPELTAQVAPSAALASFAKSYSAKYHMVPSAAAISSYDSVLMLAAAIRKQHSTRASKLQSALNSLSGSSELQGTVSFSGSDHMAVGSGQLTLVSYDAHTKNWKPVG